MEILGIGFAFCLMIWQIREWSKNSSNAKKKAAESERLDKGYKQPGELLGDMKELSPVVVKKLRTKTKAIAPTVKMVPKYHDVGNGFFDLAFDKNCNYGQLLKWTPYIAKIFFAKGVIPAPVLKAVQLEDFYTIRYQVERPKDFIYADKGKEGFLSKIKDKYHKLLEDTRGEEWPVFMGETFNLLQDIMAQLVVKALTGPHSLVVGENGSGKTTTIKSLVYMYAFMYPKLIPYFTDGKGSTDYNNLAAKLSPLPVAFPAKGCKDKMVHLADMLLVHIQAEWDRRKALFLKVGAANFVQYNRMVSKEEQIGPLLFVIDEFNAWVTESPVSPLASDMEEGTIFGTIRKLIAEGRSSGIIVIIGNQGITSEIPSPWRKNLNNTLIHRTKETGGIDLSPEIKKELTDAGKYVFKKTGLTDASGEELILAVMPYLDTDDLIWELDIPTPAKLEFNESLLYKTGINNNKATIDDLAKTLREFLFKPAGWEIAVENRPSTDFTAFVLNKGESKLHISIVGSEELHKEAFFDRISRQVGTTLLGHKQVIFAFGATAAGKVVELREAFENNGYSLILEEDYTRILNKAADIYFESKAKNELFDDLLKMYAVHQIKTQSSLAESLNKPINKVELTPEYLDRIIKMKAGTKGEQVSKGDLFEQLLKAAAIYNNCAAFISTDLFKMGFRKDPGAGDGGLDLMWVRNLPKGMKPEDVDLMNLPEELLDERIVIQAKNYNKSSLGNDIISHLLKASFLYAGPSKRMIKNLWLMHTDGRLSDQFRQEFKELGPILAEYGITLSVYDKTDIVGLFPKQDTQNEVDETEFKKEEIIYGTNPDSGDYLYTSRKASAALLEKLGIKLSHDGVSKLRRERKGKQEEVTNE